MLLVNYDNEEVVREATEEEIEMCREAHKERGGCGSFVVDDVPYYVRGALEDLEE